MEVGNLAISALSRTLGADSRTGYKIWLSVLE